MSHQNVNMNHLFCLTGWGKTWRRRLLAKLAHVGWFWPRSLIKRCFLDEKSESVKTGSPSVVSNSLQPHGLCSPWNFPGQNTGVGSLSCLQGIFPIRGSNPGLPYCRRILNQLNHKGSPRNLEWVVSPFSSRSSPPRNWTRVSFIAGGLSTNWATWESLYTNK